MMRLSLVLLAAVLASALWLVRLQYESRTLYTAIDKAVAESRKLETERDTLEVQKRTQTASLHVQSVARNQLGMREASPGVTQYVTLQAGGKVVVTTPVGASVTSQAGPAVRSAPRSQP